MKKKKLKAKIKKLEFELRLKDNYINQVLSDIDKILAGNYMMVEKYKTLSEYRKSFELFSLRGGFSESFAVRHDGEDKTSGVIEQLKKKDPIPNEAVSEEDFKDVISEIGNDKKILLVVAEDIDEFYYFINKLSDGAYASIPGGAVLVDGKVYIPITRATDLTSVDEFDGIIYTDNALENPEIKEIKEILNKRKP